MKIYTRTGDKGETSLFGGKRVRKNAQRIDAYGTVDELNSALGVVRAASLPPEADQELERIQSELFTLGTDLATPQDGEPERTVRVSAEFVTRMESAIDRLEAPLPSLKTFVLPGGTEAAARIHVARTVCRRAERSVAQLSEAEKVNPHVLVYLNRLSDLLFVMARFANHAAGIADRPWKAR